MHMSWGAICALRHVSVSLLSKCKLSRYNTVLSCPFTLHHTALLGNSPQRTVHKNLQTVCLLCALLGTCEHAWRPTSDQFSVLYSLTQPSADSSGRLAADQSGRLAANKSGRLPANEAPVLAGVHRIGAQLLLNAQQLVVLRQPLAPAEVRSTATLQLCQRTSNVDTPEHLRHT
jgi:hypothetical protein